MKYLRKLKIALVKGDYQNLVKGQVREPVQLYETFKAIKDKAQETVIVVYLTDDLNTIAYDIHSVGGQSVSLILPDDLFGRGYALRAKYFILIHNHPSGNPTPSGGDEETIALLTNQARIMNIKFLDFIIVGDPADTASPHYWSWFEEEGGGEYLLGAVGFS